MLSLKAETPALLPVNAWDKAELMAAALLPPSATAEAKEFATTVEFSCVVVRFK